MSVKEKFMKNIFTLAFLVMIGLKATSQNIIPLENYKPIKEAGLGVPANSYIKDVNHLLDFFIGTWQGVQNNKTYTFYVVKEVRNFFDSKEDRLVIRYTIQDANNNFIVDGRNATINDAPLLTGNLYYLSGAYNLHYDYNFRAGMTGQVTIKKYQNYNNKMTLVLALISDMMDSSQALPFDSESVLPTTHIILTKQ
jgi:hypothetical protein